MRLLLAQMVALLSSFWVALLLSGCSGLKNLPDGVQLQSSTFGVKVSPSAPDGTPFVIGSHTTIITTPQPPDAGPNLNRFEGGAGVAGATVKSTVASGAVGDQLEKAGPAIEAVVGAGTPAGGGE